MSVLNIAEKSSERNLIRRLSAGTNPLRQIAENTGEDVAVIAGTTLSKGSSDWGFDAHKGAFQDFKQAAIIGPRRIRHATALCLGPGAN